MLDNEKLKNYVIKNFPNHELIYGPNWIIVKPLQEELDHQKEISYYKSKIDKECIICHSIFRYGQTKKEKCDIHRVFTICSSPECNEIKEVNFDDYSGDKQKILINALINIEPISVNCDKTCSNKARKCFGTCPNCGHKDVEIYNSRCTYCANKELNGPIKCPTHGYQEKSFGGICIICHNQTDEMREQTRELGKITGPINMRKINERHLEFCENCKKETIHNGFGRCLTCKPLKRNWNFIKLDILTYKNEPVYQILEKLDSGEYDLKDFPGFNKKWCRNCNKLEWHYDTDCLVCETKNILDSNNLQFRDGVAYWKNELVSDIISKLESGEYNQEDYPEFNKRFCNNCQDQKWHLNTECLTCGNENLKTGPYYKFNMSIATYKGEFLSDIIDRIESGEDSIDNYPGLNERLCTNCGDVQYHFGTRCTVCDSTNKLSTSKYIYISGVKYYKLDNGEIISYEQLANELLNGIRDIDDFRPKLNIRHDHVCNGTEDIVTGEKIYVGGPNFRLIKDVEYIVDRSSGKLVPTDEFYASYDEKVKSIDPDQQVKDFIEAEGFEIVPIIGDGVEKWNRSQTDKYLSDHGYGYFCYVKLLDGRLWIGGKTSTFNASNSPIDFDFKLYDEKNPDNPDYAGAGREYARRYYPDWKYSDFKFVLCKRCNSEQEALEMEDYIVKKYNLFES